MNKTKCIVLGEQPTEVKKKPIEFLKDFSSEGVLYNTMDKPSDWKFIELICINYSKKLGDVMFAHDGDRSNGCLFFGKWNDGVAE